MIISRIYPGKDHYGYLDGIKDCSWWDIQKDKKKGKESKQNSEEEENCKEMFA